jgi:hypothetical protein
MTQGSCKCKLSMLICRLVLQLAAGHFPQTLPPALRHPAVLELAYHHPAHSTAFALQAAVHPLIHC